MFLPKITLITKTAQLKVENLAQTTFGFSPVGFRLGSLTEGKAQHD
jgi:hypothetical protein